MHNKKKLNLKAIFVVVLFFFILNWQFQQKIFCGNQISTLALQNKLIATRTAVGNVDLILGITRLNKNFFYNFHITGNMTSLSSDQIKLKFYHPLFFVLLTNWDAIIRQHFIGTSADNLLYLSNFIQSFVLTTHPLPEPIITKLGGGVSFFQLCEFKNPTSGVLQAQYVSNIPQYFDPIEAARVLELFGDKKFIELNKTNFAAILEILKNELEGLKIGEFLQITKDTDMDTAGGKIIEIIRQCYLEPTSALQKENFIEKFNTVIFNNFSEKSITAAENQISELAYKTSSLNKNEFIGKK